MRRYKLLCIAFLVVTSAGLVFAKDSAEKQVDSYENSSVLVEAFMVQVSTEALVEVGVNPISQSPENISILKIIACLDDAQKAEILSGAKVNCRNNNESEIRNEDRIYIKIGTGDTFHFESYSSGRALTASPRIQLDGRIQLEASYSDTIITLNEDPAAPPAQASYDWSGVLTLKTGIPAIAGATQNDDTVTFLILTATIQN